MVIGKGACDRALSESEVRKLMRIFFYGAGLSATCVGHHPGRHANRADSDDVPPLSRIAERPSSSRLPDRARHASADERGGDQPPRRGLEEMYDVVRSINIFNHRWDEPGQLVELGEISEGEIREITGGLLRQSVKVRLNETDFRLRPDHHLRPDFPHEVVGFSGGNNISFPASAALK